MITPHLLFLIAAGAFVGAAAGYLGSFMVLKRMALVGDALSHVALPGMAIALTLHHSPMLGAFITLTLAVIGIWYFQQTSTIYPEALVGIFFTASLAIGFLITPEAELLEALFGDIHTLATAESLIAICLSLLIIIATAAISKKLLLMSISEELAKSLKIPVNSINFTYLFLVGSVVALGVKFVGSLLMGALVIIPAAAAKNISSGLKSYYFWSIFFGVASAIFGILLAEFSGVSPGPIVVLTSAGFFLISHLVKNLSR